MQTIRWELYPLVAQNPIARAFIEERALGHSSWNTLDNYSRDIDSFLRLCIQLPFSLVVEADESLITRYVGALWSQPARHGSGHAFSKGYTASISPSNLAQNTIRRRVSTVRVFYDWCIRTRRRRDQLNPVSRGVWGQERGLVPYQPSAPWIPSEDTFADLLLYVFATLSLRNQVLILVLYDGALRREEVTFLKVADIDERTHTIKIPHELTKNKMQGHIVLSNTTWKVLQEYLREDRARLVATYGTPGEGQIFLSESNQNAGRPIGKWAVTKVFDGVRNALRMPQLTPHKLRHLMLTHLMNYGLDLYEISCYARHRSMSSTEVYLHVSDTKLARKVNKIHAKQWKRLESLFNNRKRPTGGGS